jgi:hypothetical protein
MFSGNELMKEMDAAGQNIRELDRQKARRRGVRQTIADCQKGAPGVPLDEAVERIRRKYQLPGRPTLGRRA